MEKMTFKKCDVCGLNDTSEYFTTKYGLTVCCYCVDCVEHENVREMAKIWKRSEAR